MSDDIHRKRAFVAALYPGKHWKNKVKNMPDIQVTAIYLREQGKPKKAPEKEINNHDDIPF